MLGERANSILHEAVVIREKECVPDGGTAMTS